MLPGATDRLLLAFSRTGDARALGKVFDRTAPELLRVALYLCGDRTDAEDLLQRTFLSAIESRASYDPRRRAVPWLLGILANHARRLQHERARRRAIAPPVPPAHDDPQAAASNSELREQVDRLRAELGPPYAEVLALHFEGLNAKEIAARLGRPAGTVRTQLMRALERVRKHLPAGFVTGLLPPLPGAAALLELKSRVLFAAGHATHAAGAPATTATLTTGGLLMSKKLGLALSAGVLLLAAGLYTVWPGSERAPSTPPGSAIGEGARPTGPAMVTAADSTADATLSARLPVATLADDSDPGFGALRVLVRWRDGKPAAGVGVGADGLDAARNERRIAVTAADGTCLLPHLRAAPWQIALTHAAQGTRVDVRAGAPQPCELVAEVVATARGCVVDEQQRSVADAEIWIAPAPDHRHQFAVARSGADGRFALPLALPVHIGARKAGFAASHAAAVDPTKPLDDVVLELRGPGHCVEGTVRDARGQPIAWARVQVGCSFAMSASFNGPYEQQRFTAAGPEAWTDRDGRYSAECIEPGRETVQAWAPGHGPAIAVIEVTATATTCDLTLPDSAVVQGQVRDAAGHPVDGAAVHQFLELSSLIACGTTTDAEGRYRLQDLAPGRADFEAVHENARFSDVLDLAAGVVTEWNPVLRSVTDIRGRVLDADGQPIAAAIVCLCESTGLPDGSPQVVTDAAGSFALQPADQGPVNVRIGDLRDPPLQIVRKVRPGTQDLVVRLTTDDLPSARVRGRVIDGNGRPVVATVSATRSRQAQGRQVEAGADGRFELGPIPAGRYRVRIATPKHGSMPLPEFDLAAGAERDLGDVALQLPGSATVDVRDEEGKPARSFVMLYTRDGEWTASMQTDAGRATFPALQPGSYFVCCGGAPLAAHGELEVLSAATAHADLQLAPVGYADVTVRDPAQSSELDLNVFAFTAGRFAGMFGNFHGMLRVRAWLPPGTYSLEVRAHDGRRARAELAIRDVEDHPQVTAELPPK